MQQVLFKQVLLKTVEYFLFIIFKFFFSRLLAAFQVSGSRYPRNCPISYAPALSNVTLVVISDSIVLS